MDKKSFLIYLDYEEQLNLLTDEQVGQLIRAIIQYEKTLEMPQLEGTIQMAFSFIKAQLDRDREKWQDEKTKRSNAGKKGMTKRWKSDENNDANNKNNNVTNVITKDNNDNKAINDITKITVDVDADVAVKVKDNVKVDVDVADAVAVYENNIAPATGISREILLDYCKDLSPELVKEAIRKAVLSNNRTLKYIRGILNSWDKKGFKSLIDVKNEEEEFRKAKENKSKKFETKEEEIARRIKELEEVQKHDGS